MGGLAALKFAFVCGFIFVFGSCICGVSRSWLDTFSLCFSPFGVFIWRIDPRKLCKWELGTGPLRRRWKEALLSGDGQKVNGSILAGVFLPFLELALRADGLLREYRTASSCFGRDMERDV